MPCKKENDESKPCLLSKLAQAFQRRWLEQDPAGLSRMLALLATTFVLTAAAEFDTWSLVLLDEAVGDGAVCLDGSPAGLGRGEGLLISSN